MTAAEREEATVILRNAGLALGVDDRTDALLAVLRAWRTRNVAPIDDFDDPLDVVALLG